MARHSAGDKETWGGTRGESRLLLSPVECTHVPGTQSRRRAQEDRWTEQGEGGRGQGFLDAPPLAWLVPSCPLYTHHSPSSKRDGLRDEIRSHLFLALNPLFFQCLENKFKLLILHGNKAP